MPFFGRKVPAPDQPRSFGSRVEWLAFRTTNVRSLIEILNLKGTRQVSWESGLLITPFTQLSKRVFMTPPLGGWILAVNYLLPNSPRQEIVIEHMSVMSELTAARVCYFASFPSVNCHCWGLAESGNVVRLYGYSDGSLLYNYGAVTAEERDLDVRYWHEPVLPQEEEKLAGEQTVWDLAGRWSIDPSRLRESFHEPGLGIVGKQGKWIHPHRGSPTEDRDA